MLDIPVELFLGFIGMSFVLVILGVSRDPKIPALVLFAGMFILPLVLITDNIIMGFSNNGSIEAINHYDVGSSTGQVLINSVTAHSRGERLSNTASILEGDTIDCVTVWLGRSGIPPITTLIRIGIMDINTVMVKEFGSMNVTALLTSSVTPYTFCLPVGDTYTFTDTETVGIKWNSGDATNTLTTRIDSNNPFNGSNTEHVHATASTWIANAGQDVMMLMTLRGSTAIIEPINYEFTEFPKTIFALYSVVLMLIGALLTKMGM